MKLEVISTVKDYFQKKKSCDKLSIILIGLVYRIDKGYYSEALWEKLKCDV